jgi:hypothetical protein
MFDHKSLILIFYLRCVAMGGDLTMMSVFRYVTLIHLTFLQSFVVNIWNKKLCWILVRNWNQPTRCNSFASLLLDVYVWLNMFRAPLRPSSGAYNCTRSLWFYRWGVVVGALLIVVWQDNLSDHDQHRSWRWTERCPKHVEPHINVK